MTDSYEFFCFYFVFLIFALIGQAFVLKKAGRKKSIALIPYYKMYVITDIAGQNKKFLKWLIVSIIRLVICTILFFLFITLFTFKDIAVFGDAHPTEQVYNTTQGLYLLIGFCSILFAVFSLICLGQQMSIYADLSECFGKTRFFGIMMAVLPGILFPVIGFGKISQYQDPKTKQQDSNNLT